jgi:hypothetical protein
VRNSLFRLEDLGIWWGVSVSVSRARKDKSHTGKVDFGRAKLVICELFSQIFADFREDSRYWFPIWFEDQWNVRHCQPCCCREARHCAWFPGQAAFANQIPMPQLVADFGSLEYAHL